MTDAVETMAYTNEVPWHGLGVRLEKAATPAAMLKHAGLDWRVDRVPLYAGESRKPIEGFAALQRSSDGKTLDVVGSRYKPVQNEDVFAFFKEFTEAGEATMETAGSLNGGRYVWALANLSASFSLAGGDRVNGYLLVASPHIQGKTLVVKFTTIRVVCQNTLSLALRSGGSSWRMSHTRSFDSVTQAEAKEALGIARDQMGEFEATARKLKKMKLDRKKIVEVLAMTFQPGFEVKELLKDSSLLSRKMEVLLDVNEKAPGADPGTGWGLLNAVTYYADHVASRTADKRLTNAWLGKTANQKEAVLESLLELA
jgi:phage/plasmid-like protein (TIGR03299 family)